MYLRYHDLEKMEAWEINYELKEAMFDGETISAVNSLRDLGISRKNLLEEDTGGNPGTFRKIGQREGLLRKSASKGPNSVLHKPLHRRSSAELAIGRTRTETSIGLGSGSASRRSENSYDNVSEAESRRVCVPNWNK